MIIKETQIAEKPRSSNVKIITLFLLLAIFQLLTASNATAQNQNIIILDENSTAFSIAKHSYVTIDEMHDLTANLITERAKSNLYGRRNNGDIINLGSTTHPSWILFSVNNQTKNEDWVLDFGNILNGRLGMANKIHLTNDTTKQSIIYPEKEGDNISPFIGSALPIKIKAGEENTFVIYIENGHGLPLTIAPKIMPKEAYVKQALGGDTKTTAITIILLIVILFFITNGSRYRNKGMLVLSLYYMLLGTFLFAFNNNLINNGIINATTMFILYMASFSTLTIAIKLLADGPNNNGSIKNIVITIINIILTITSIGYIFIFEANAHNILLLTLITASCIVIAMILSIFKNKNPANVNIALFSGIGFILLSASVIPISAYINITTSLIINSLWYLQIPGILCFIYYYFKNIEYIKIQEDNINIQKSHQEDSRSRLQTSKNSADQARLLRIIDQEKELMAELRQREVKRAEEMRQAKEVADKANHDKSAFLAVVSHEIRTPMNGILGMIQLIKDTEMTERQRGYVEVIHKSSDTMMVLLNDILDFEKIENGSMELEIIAFNLKQLISDIVILMSSYATQKNITLNAAIADNAPTIVMGDPTRLRQVLLNLINNALKFTEEGHVTIEVNRLGSESSNLIYFAVKDSGIGMSKDAQTKLFTPFKQAEASTSRKYGGTGLGLAISSKLIEAMGAKIKVESEQGVGSSFYFEVRMEEKDLSTFIEDNKDSDKNNKAQKIAKPMDILVVEDNEMNRKVMDGFLSQKGHRLSMAASGIEALEICQKTEFDLILMDIQMDGMSGIETTKKLRVDSNKQIATTPIIAITGNVMLEDVEGYFAVGMNGFIAKPIDANNLNEVIYNASVGKFENLPEPRPNPRPSVDLNSQANNAQVINQDITKKPKPINDMAEDSIEQKPPEETTAYSIDIDDNLDTGMLNGLMETLGKDTFIELLIGFVEKAEEIIENMGKLSEEKDIPSLGARAHELKGMAGNFGMKKVSAIAGDIEKNAKISNENQAVEQTKELNAAIIETKAAFDKLLT